jgi:hypothetical protein
MRGMTTDIRRMLDLEITVLLDIMKVILDLERLSAIVGCTGKLLMVMMESENHL